MENAKKIEERKEKKNRLKNSETWRTKKEVKKSNRQDKRRYNLAQLAEEAAGKRSMEEVYSITRRLVGKPNVADRPVKDKIGTVLSNQSDQLKR